MPININIYWDTDIRIPASVGRSAPGSSRWTAAFGWCRSWWLATAPAADNTSWEGGPEAWSAANGGDHVTGGNPVGRLRKSWKNVLGVAPLWEGYGLFVNWSPGEMFPSIFPHYSNSHGIYPLVICRNSYWKCGPVEIVDEYPHWKWWIFHDLSRVMGQFTRG